MLTSKVNTSFGLVFSILCFVATILLSIDCIVTYLKDDDISRNDYTKYHHDEQGENVYPSISLCVINPFLDQQLKKYGDDINITSYSYFLQGLHWDDRMLEIDYDNVTVSLEKSLISTLLKLHERDADGKRIEMHYDPKTQHDKILFKPKFYVSFQSAIRKCFTFDIPVIKKHLVYHYLIKVRNTIFPNGKRPSTMPKKFDGSDENSRGFAIYLHYPGQRFTSYHTIKENWKERHGKKKNNSYIMVLKMDEVEVIRYRHKKTRPCMKNWKIFDQTLLDDIMKAAACHPPHWNTTNYLPLCSTKKQMKYFKDQPKIADVLKYDPPCQVIKMLRYSYYEKEVPKSKLIGMKLTTAMVTIIDA